MAFTTMQDFKLIRGEDTVKDYQFNKMVINHRFCATYGILSFAGGEVKMSNVAAVACVAWMGSTPSN